MGNQYFTSRGFSTAVRAQRQHIPVVLYLSTRTYFVDLRQIFDSPKVKKLYNLLPSWMVCCLRPSWELLIGDGVMERGGYLNEWIQLVCSEVRLEVEITVDKANVSSVITPHAKTKKLFSTRKRWEYKRRLQDFFAMRLYCNCILILLLWSSSLGILAVHPNFSIFRVQSMNSATDQKITPKYIEENIGRGVLI